MSATRAAQVLPALVTAAVAAACDRQATAPPTHPSPTEASAPPPADAAPDPATGQPDRAAIDDIARRVLESDVAVGLAVGVTSGGGRGVHGYGEVRAGTGRVPNADTVFSIGSVTKAFTGLALADAVRRGEVELDQPVAELLPDEVEVPRSGDGAPIRLRHLATHTSGLPNTPGNLAPDDPHDPYADYDADQLYAFLSDHDLARAPGEAYSYSNVGAGLLGHALARRAGTDFGALIRKRIAEPLGMNATALTFDDPDRAATGHMGGTPVPVWHFDVLAGAGELRSSARDMLAFVEANLEPGERSLASAIRASHEPRAEFPGGNVALGWHVGRPGMPEVIWHNGQTGGFHAYVAFDPERGIGAVLLANSGVKSIDRAGDAVMHVLRGEDHELALPEALDLDPEILERYVGTYRLTPMFSLEVTRHDDQLFIRGTGQPKIPVYAKSEATFAARVVEAKVVFEGADDGRADRLILHQGGQKKPAERVDPEPDPDGVAPPDGRD